MFTVIITTIISSVLQSKLIAWRLKKETITFSWNVGRNYYFFRVKSQMNEHLNTLLTKLRYNVLLFSSMAEDLAASDITSAGADAQLFWSPLEKLINTRGTERYKI